MGRESSNRIISNGEIIIMHELILYLRYRKESKLIKVSVEIERESISYDDLAWLFAEKLTELYAQYLGGKKVLTQNDKRMLRRYMLGQYKFLKNYLESVL